MKKFRYLLFLSLGIVLFFCLSSAVAYGTNPTAESWFQKGYDHGQKNEYEEAIRDYSEAIRIDPKHRESYNNRGFAYRKTGKLDAAVQDYGKAIELCKKSPAIYLVYVNRGAVYYMMGEYDRAIKDFNKAIAMDPKNIEAYVNRGLSYNKLGNSRQAIADLKVAARLGHMESQNWLTSKGVSW